ncbi:MAG: hypothetical protein VX252_13945 [Myxococcota bacterium]|nr:hypothetical protein [Myxococcota bacterium]
MPSRKNRKARTAPDYALEVHERYLLITFSGNLTAQVLAQTTDEIHADPRFQTLNDLWDLRACSDTDLDYGQVQNIFSHIQSRGFREHKRSAIVVADEHHFGLSRIYQALSDNETENDLSVEIFRDLKSAQNWIEQDEG